MQGKLLCVYVFKESGLCDDTFIGIQNSGKDTPTTCYECPVEAGLGHWVEGKPP